MAHTHDEDRRPKDETQAPRSKDSRPVHMTGGDAHGGQLSAPNAQEIDDVGSSGQGEINFDNPDYNRQHNLHDVEGLEEQEEHLHKERGHATPAAKRREIEHRDTSEEHESQE